MPTSSPPPPSDTTKDDMLPTSTRSSLPSAQNTAPSATMTADFVVAASASMRTGVADVLDAQRVVAVPGAAMGCAAASSAQPGTVARPSLIRPKRPNGTGCGIQPGGRVARPSFIGNTRSFAVKLIGQCAVGDALLIHPAAALVLIDTDGQTVCVHTYPRHVAAPDASTVDAADRLPLDVAHGTNRLNTLLTIGRYLAEYGFQLVSGGCRNRDALLFMATYLCLQPAGFCVRNYRAPADSHHASTLHDRRLHPLLPASLWACPHRTDANETKLWAAAASCLSVTRT